MKIRERKILLHLLKNDLVTIIEIAKEVGASEKTIRMDLKKANIVNTLATTDLQLIKKRGRGIKIVGSESEKMNLIKELEHDQEELNYVLYNQKECYILLILLISSRPISIAKLETKLFLTRGIIYSALKSVEEICCDYNLTLEKDNNTYQIIGPEKNYRYLIFKTVRKLYTTSEVFSSTCMYDLLAKLGYDLVEAKVIFAEVEQIVCNFEQVFTIKLIGDSLEYFKLKMFISINRYRDKKYVENTEQFQDKVYELTDATKINKMKEHFYQLYHQEYLEAEILYYISQLSTLQTYYINVKKFVLPTAKTKINIINNEIKQELKQQLGIKLTTSDCHYLEKVLIQNYNAFIFEENQLNISEYDLILNQKYLQSIEQIVKTAIRNQEPELIKNQEFIKIISQYLTIKYEPKLKTTIILKGSYEEIKLISALILRDLQNVDIIDIFPVIMDRFIKPETELIITNTKINTKDDCVIFFSNPLNHEAIKLINEQIIQFKSSYDFPSQ